ncbi:hypothetical protein ACH41E_03035 [Streptomyces sp. NPDC020412]|uniref:hypothetical protein n=1 Tax=Streptomyces sp. NPDC020412 TaxID=3365073 RepID=UPI0037920E84
MTTRRRQAAHDSGEDIWNRVAEAGEAGLLTEQAMGRNTRGQFERGKAWIKDKKCQAEKMGWVYHHGTYIVTNDPNDCTMYATERLRSLFKQTERVYKCAILPLPPEAQKLPTVRLLRSLCESIFASMSVLESAGFSAPTATQQEASKPQKAASSRGRKLSR